MDIVGNISVLTVFPPYRVEQKLAELCESRRTRVSPSQHIADRINAGLSPGEKPETMYFAVPADGYMSYLAPSFDLTHEQVAELFTREPQYIPHFSRIQLQAGKLWVHLFGKPPATDAAVEWLGHRVALWLDHLMEVQAVGSWWSESTARWCSLALYHHLTEQRHAAICSPVAHPPPVSVRHL